MNTYHDQPFDRALQAALHNLPVPPGLEERLLASLGPASCDAACCGAASQGPALDTASAPVELAASAETPRASSQVGSPFWKRPSWRTLTLAASAAVVLVAASLGVHSWIESRHIIEQEQIASALGGWQKALTTSRPENGLPSDFVLPPLAVKPVKYVPFKTDEGWSAVAVDCTPPSGTPATLFIVRSSARFRVPAAPYTRLSAATGKTIAAWQEGRLLYVLVVEESNSQRLEDFVRRPSYLRSNKRRSAIRPT